MISACRVVDLVDTTLAPSLLATFPPEAVTEAQRTALVAGDLQATLEGMVRHVFGADLEVRWVDAYFPFTVPSFELEILFNGDWLETLGCGVVHPTLMSNARAAGGLDDGIGCVVFLFLFLLCVLDWVACGCCLQVDSRKNPQRPLSFATMPR